MRMLSRKRNIQKCLLTQSYSALKNASCARLTYWYFFVNPTNLLQTLRLFEKRAPDVFIYFSLIFLVRKLFTSSCNRKKNSYLSSHSQYDVLTVLHLLLIITCYHLELIIFFYVSLYFEFSFQCKNLTPLLSISCFFDYCGADQLFNLHPCIGFLNRKYSCWPSLVNLLMFQSV